MKRLALIFGLTTMFFCAKGFSQKWLEQTDTLVAQRLNLGIGGISGLYTGFAVGLYTSWYAQYPTSHFHFFNDWDEWRNMDKYGHLQGSYAHTHLVFTGARWAGMSRKSALVAGVASSLVFQNTIEILDGFSEKWGFSVPDAIANFTGVGLFACQEWLWKEQRIKLKFAPSSVSHSSKGIPSLTDPTVLLSPQDRTEQLFGNRLAEKWLKDYNRHTYWVSFQIKPWLGAGNNWPDWLCLGIGVGAGNLYGGFSNRWTTDQQVFDASHSLPRYSRFFIGPDIDLQNIGNKRPWMKTLFSVSQIFRIPLPCIEWNTRGEWVFHILR